MSKVASQDNKFFSQLWATKGLTSRSVKPAGFYSKYKNTKTKFQKFQVMNTIFDIPNQYDITEAIGCGGFGLVVAANVKSTNKKDTKDSKEELPQIAIKKIDDPFEHLIYATLTLRELKVMRLLNHDNILKLHTIFLPKSREEFNDIYIAMPMIEYDLNTLIKSNQPIPEDLVKFLIYQLLRGLKYMHSAGIIHRDLKPTNLLLTSDCGLKIADFGCSRTILSQHKNTKMTNRTGTRWYRAPELLLEQERYGTEVDIWAVGCIMGELYQKKPLLQGKTTETQLELIFDYFGNPTKDVVDRITKPALQQALSALSPRRPQSFKKLFPTADPLGIDLFEKMMQLDCKKRISAEDALKHPYFKELHDPTDEPVASPVSLAEFEFEKQELSIEVLKDLLYEEILLYHFEDFQKEYFQMLKKMKV